LRDFEWDETKRQAGIKKHSVDIVYAALIFEGPVLTRIDDRADYGEVRLISVGLIDNECFVVVHTERDETTRLITAWKGGRDERSYHEAGIARADQGDAGKG
jgi:uncharacterized protein